ncbi:unnamed protein product [Ranitomeya imitator]|uniref:Uncharacterized protein n=1 Tax=Ranitomeya imitator TaxID=111125 RepID=A0ABN9L1K5_9NEOB|nr:unnamed protein product [Ranitomeya imitator]
MTLTVEHLQRAIASSKDTIKNIETQLSSSSTAEELEALKIRIKTVTDQHRRDTESRKRTKFQRDSDDYENNRVYRWQDKSTFYPNTTRSDFHSSIDLSTSGSETERRDNPAKTTTTTKKKRIRRSQRKKRRRLLQGDPVPGKTPLVINISSRTLSIAEHNVLQKGLSFCPSYKFDTFNMDMDLHRFYRRLRLLVHFDSPETSPITTSDTSRSLISSHNLGLRNKSMYRPPKASHAVEAFIGFIEQSFSKLRQDIEARKLHTSTNLSAPDFQALQSLRNDKNIIIKPADKGGAIVVMNRSDYTKEIHRQLHDGTVYRPLSSDPTTMIRNHIKDTLGPYVEKGVIDDNTREYLTKDFPITPVFYILPKIHKNLEHPPGRPILASTESILSPLAIFLEKILTPLIHTLPSFLLDTGDFLRQLWNLDSLPPDLLLVSLDVKDLCTSIPHTQGILSVRHLLTNSLLHPDVINLCIDLLTIVLTKKFFHV